jgi:hypothetical protein
MHAMKAIAVIVVLLLVVVSALQLLPAASAFQMYLSGGAVALSLVALIAILVMAYVDKVTDFVNAADDP